MTSQTLERLTMAAAHGVLIRIDARSHGGAIRTQAAVVRSLLDELDRHLGSDRCAVCLCDQIKDELLRLLALLRAATSEARASTTPFTEPNQSFDVA